MLKTTAEAVALAIVGVSSSGSASIGLAALADNAGTGNSLTTDTWVPLGLFLAGVAMTATVVWKVAAHKTITDQRIKEITRRMQLLEEKLRE